MKTISMEDGWVVIVVQGGREYVNGIYHTMAEAEEAARGYAGSVTIWAVKYKK